MHYQLAISRWIGRLCNNLTQLTNAVYVARETQSTLAVPDNLRGLNVADFDFSNGEPCSPIEATVFFDPNEELKEIPREHRPGKPTWNERRKILRNDLRHCLPSDFFPPSQDGPVEDLVIHIRSGDVFHPAGRIAGKHPWTPDFLLRAIRMITKKGNPVNPFFVQPPLSFYRRIIESRDWPGIRIVAEDTANPVIPELIARYPQIRFAPASLAEDIRVMLRAKHLVIGYGTFGITLSLLSEHIESLFAPELTELALGPLQPEDLSEVDVTTFRFRNYIAHGEWKLSAAQKRLMVEHADADLEEVAAQPLESASPLG